MCVEKSRGSHDILLFYPCVAASVWSYSTWIHAERYLNASLGHRSKQIHVLFCNFSFFFLSLRLKLSSVQHENCMKVKLMYYFSNFSALLKCMQEKSCMLNREVCLLI